MSMKTPEWKAVAEVITFDKRSIFLTMDEYQVYKQIESNPDIKVMQFDDGEFSLADIRRVEILAHPITDDSHKLESGINEPDLNEDEWLEMIAKRSRTSDAS